jgi:uncharacterized protein (TIGR02391 family)
MGDPTKRTTQARFDSNDHPEVRRYSMETHRNRLRVNAATLRPAPVGHICYDYPMLTELVAKFPEAGRLLDLSAAQLDAVLLACIATRANDPSPIAAKYVYRDEISGLYPIGVGTTAGQRQAVDQALMESWERLKSSNIIMQAPGQAPDNMTLTARGKEIAGTGNMDEIMAQANLKRQMLHPLLRASVYDSFATGHYDTAVRDAFVIVEDRVKIVSGNKTDIGVRLMRAAFNPNGGPQTLTDMTLPMAERERMADLFAGAIGTYKNPLSHRVVGNSDPAPVIEELMIASRLLRYVP